MLVKALSLPAWSQRDWLLDIFGEGPFRSYYEELVAQLRLSDRVKFCGFQSDVRRIWASHHLLALTSQYEGTPLVIVEAMLLGRPVLATDVGGAREWVIDGQTGFLAQAPTVASVAAALERAWAARAGWEEIGAAARILAHAQFDHNAGQTLLNLMLQSVAAKLDPLTSPAIR